MCRFTAVILAHRRKEDYCEFEVSIDCIIRLYYKKKRRKKEEKEARDEGRKKGRKSENRDMNIDFLPK